MSLLSLPSLRCRLLTDSGRVGRGSPLFKVLAAQRVRRQAIDRPDCRRLYRPCLRCVAIGMPVKVDRVMGKGVRGQRFAFFKDSEKILKKILELFHRPI